MELAVISVILLHLFNMFCVPGTVLGTVQVCVISVHLQTTF